MTIFGKVFGPWTQMDMLASGTGVAARRPEPTESSAIEKRDRLLMDASMLNVAGRHGEALALLLDGQGSIPETPELLFARASILFDWGRFREARDGYVRAEAAGMCGATLQFQLGWAHFHTGNLTAAEGCLRIALALVPADRTIRASMAKVLFELGRFKDAEGELNSVLELFPGDVESRWLLGICKVRQRDPIAAESHFRSALGSGAD